MDAHSGAAPPSKYLSSELLDFRIDTRVLIVNCDDLGMHESVNAALFEAVQEGIASSASLMVPCPAADQAMQMLRRTPSMPFGIHLTLTRDGPSHHWAPVAPAAHVPSLVDENGLLLTSAAAPQLLAQARLEDVERELREVFRRILANR